MIEMKNKKLIFLYVGKVKDLDILKEVVKNDTQRV